jgi:hypothetical protein
MLKIVGLETGLPLLLCGRIAHDAELNNDDVEMLNDEKFLSLDGRDHRQKIGGCLLIMRGVVKKKYHISDDIPAGINKQIVKL